MCSDYEPAEELAVPNPEREAQVEYWDRILAEADRLDAMYAEAAAFDEDHAVLPPEDAEFFEDPMDELRPAALDHRGRP
jgi:hypothetical protein